MNQINVSAPANTERLYLEHVSSINTTIIRVIKNRLLSYRATIPSRIEFEKGRPVVEIPAALRHRSQVRYRCTDRLPPRKVADQTEELQRSSTARSVTRARTRGTRYTRIQVPMAGAAVRGGGGRAKRERTEQKSAREKRSRERSRRKEER